MNEERPDLLQKIFEKADASAPAPKRPRFEYPPEEETSPPPPDQPPEDKPPSPPPDRPIEKAAVNTKLLPWLCLVLGFALLVLGVCVLQMVEMNGRLDQLQEAVEAVQAVDSLRAENEQLQKDIEDLQGQLDQQTELNERFMETWDEESTRMQVLTIQKWQAEYLFYIGQFMENGDWPMAAFAAALDADMYFQDAYVNSQQVPVNEAQLAQYQAYKQELVDRGYLQLTYAAIIDSSPHALAIPEQWDPSKSDDMAALGILWCALNAHFIQGNDNAASQYLFAFPLAYRDYQERVERLASDLTLELFQAMKDDLVELDALYIDPNGTMTIGGWMHTNEGYGLPFELPTPDPTSVVYYG